VEALRSASVVVLIVALPLVSWCDGSGQLAWTMFTRTGQFRLTLFADGKQINPTAVAARAMPGPTGVALAGADGMKHHDVMRATMRRHLEDVARLACRLRPTREVVARLEERVRTTEPIRVSEVTVRCDR